MQERLRNGFYQEQSFPNRYSRYLHQTNICFDKHRWRDPPILRNRVVWIGMGHPNHLIFSGNTHGIGCRAINRILCGRQKYGRNWCGLLCTIFVPALVILHNLKACRFHWVQRYGSCHSQDRSEALYRSCQNKIGNIQSGFLHFRPDESWASWNCYHRHLLPKHLSLLSGHPVFAWCPHQDSMLFCNSVYNLVRRMRTYRRAWCHWLE